MQVKCKSEYDEQRAIFTWSSYQEKRFPCLKYMFCSLAGIRLSMFQAKKAKASGNKRGVPDIIFPMQNHGYNGLFIELKREKGGVTSPEQKDFIQFLVEQNYRAVVCKGANEAIKEIESYLSNA